MTTNDPIRKEVSDDRKHIRSLTDRFLEDVRSNTSDYASINYIKASDILEEAGAVNTSSLTGKKQLPNERTGFNTALTGALTATLPMYVAVADKNNEFKLQFIMLVNPSNLTHGKTSAVQATYTRKGFVTQMWGPNQDLLTSTGKTAAFMVDGSGLTNLGRRRSFSYANFLAFLFAYRNNGYQMLDPTRFGTALTRVINVTHGVEIAYDNQVFNGHFNNFTIDEAAERPFLFDYNFEFVCSTLSNDLNEVRGHFIPIGESLFIGQPEENVRLTEEINRENRVLIERFKGIDENEVEPSTGRLSPRPFQGDLSATSEDFDREIAELERQLAELETEEETTGA